MIREATIGDINEIMRVYETARRFMAQNGNPTQWGNSYPEREIIEEDIKERRLFVLENECGICGAFVCMPGPDPTYINIYDGAWQTDEPYFAMHRIASDGRTRGFLKACFEFSYKKCPHLRIDTHRDNKVMQSALEKCGFEQRGIIYLQNGEERIAYEFIDC